MTPASSFTCLQTSQANVSTRRGNNQPFRLVPSSTASGNATLSSSNQSFRRGPDTYMHSPRHAEQLWDNPTDTVSSCLWLKWAGYEVGHLPPCSTTC